MKKFLFTLFLACLSVFTFAQSEISGKVTAADDGIGLPGVSVAVQGTTRGAITDVNGNYTINASQGETLVYSFVGMINQTISVGNQNVINVSLASDDNTLSEVVVTALGVSRDEKSLGYAVQKVDGEAISKTRSANALSSLSGNVAGAQISAPSSSLGGSTRILLRGAASVTQENRPLIVLDGIPMDNSNYNSTDTQRGAGGRDYGDATFDINPDDIETFQVLKGGPAAALYGSRGSNGVILITTKSGKKGSESLTLNTSITFDQVSLHPKLQREYGGGNGDFQVQNINGTDYNLVGYPVDESWGPKYDPSVMVLGWNAFDPEYTNDYLKPTAWVAPENDVDSFYETGMTLNNSLAFSKGYENANFRLSLGHVKTTGILPNSDLQKINVGLKGSAKLMKRVTAKASLNYADTKGFNRPTLGYDGNSVAQKFYQWGQRQLDYEKLKDYKNLDGSQRTWNRVSWDNATPKYSDNPYWTLYENYSNDRRKRTFGNVGVVIDIIDNLTLSTTLYGDTYNLAIQDRIAVGSQDVSSFSESDRNYAEWNSEFIFNYSTNVGKFDISAMFGGNRRNNTYNSLIANTNGGLVIPNLYDLNNSTDLPSIYDYESTKRVNSLFGSMSFGYDNLLYLDVTGRNDWSSTLPEANNSYFYPSATGSFIFSGLTDLPWLDFGKLRAGWARIGNDTDPYQLQSVFDVRDPFNGYSRYSNPNTFNNEGLRPEMKTTIEFGVDLRMLNNRVGLDLTYYNESTEDLITTLQTSETAGISSKYINAGEMENKGIEAMLRMTPVKKQDFQWDMSFNFSKNVNKLISLYGDTETLLISNATFRAQLYAVVGEKYGQIYGTDFVYDDNGNKLVDETGRYLASEAKSLGSILPDFNLGFTNNLSYKNFNLSFLIDHQKGGKYFSLSNMWGMYSGMLEATAANGIRENGIVLDAYTEGGEVNTTAISAQTYGADFYSTVVAQNVFSADYFKLRQASISYDLPKSILGNVFEGVSVSAFGRNLLIWGLDNKNYDPEMTTTGSGNIQGLEGGSLPPTRSYGVNLKLNF